jgi:uncharacterized protein
MQRDAQMAEFRTPRETLERLIEGVSARAWDVLPDLYAEDAVIEHPFAAPAPSRIEGRERIREHFTAVAERARAMRADNLVVR